MPDATHYFLLDPDQFKNFGRRIPGREQMQKLVAQREERRIIRDQVGASLISLVEIARGYAQSLSNILAWIDCCESACHSGGTLPRLATMSEQNIIEIRLTPEQRDAFAAVLRASRAPRFKRQAGIFMVVTDSQKAEEQCGVLRLQVAMVEWSVAAKIAGKLRAEALPIELSRHFDHDCKQSG